MMASMKLGRTMVGRGIVWLLRWLFPVLAWAKSALVFHTDFGLKDGAVSAMKGVTFGVSPALR